jgi:hypothetical protein
MVRIWRRSARRRPRAQGAAWYASGVGALVGVPGRGKGGGRKGRGRRTDSWTRQGEGAGGGGGSWNEEMREILRMQHRRGGGAKCNTQ